MAGSGTDQKELLDKFPDPLNLPRLLKLHHMVLSSKGKFRMALSPRWILGVPGTDENFEATKMVSGNAESHKTDINFHILIFVCNKYVIVFRNSLHYFAQIYLKAVSAPFHEHLPPT